jgi:replicative DNA helicase
LRVTFDPTKPMTADPRPEREILAGIALNNDLFESFALSGDHFVIQPNRRTYLAMENLHESGKQINEITLRPLLGDQDNNSLSNMIEERGDPAALSTYADMLRPDISAGI